MRPDFQSNTKSQRKLDGDTELIFKPYLQTFGFFYAQDNVYKQLSVYIKKNIYERIDSYWNIFGNPEKTIFSTPG